MDSPYSTSSIELGCFEKMVMDIENDFCQDPGSDNKNMSSDHTEKTGNRIPDPLQRWKYFSPADLTKAIKIIVRGWKFCRICKCRAA